MEDQKSNPEKKWWFRFAKVVYIFLYSFFLIVLVGGVTANFYEYSISESTLKSAMAEVLVIGIFGFVLVKTMKIAFLYISLAQKPHWKEELTTLF